MAESEPSKSINNIELGFKEEAPQADDYVKPVMDADYEKLFEPAQRFEIPSFSDTPEPSKEGDKFHYDEESFSNAIGMGHRNASFPHAHQPLAAMTPNKSSKSSKKSKKKKKKEKKEKPAKRKAPFTPSLRGLDEDSGEPAVDFEGIDNAYVHSDADSSDSGSDTVDTTMENEQTQTPKSAFFTVGDEEEEDETSPQRKSEASFQSKKSGESLPTAAMEFHSSMSDDPRPTRMFDNASEEPVVSGQAAVPMISVPSLEKVGKEKKVGAGNQDVKFVIGPETGESSTDKLEKHDKCTELHHQAPLKQPRHHHHHRRHHHHHHNCYGENDLKMRRTKGSEVQIDQMLKRVPTEADEAKMLEMADLDDMSSHRFEDVRGIRRHKIAPRSAMTSFVQIGKTEQKIKKGPVKAKKQFDHSPHELFVELDELYLGENKDWEWRERARWIKFEEDVEEGAERWGKPHVASLSFHSLLELRKGLESGVVLLDLEAQTLSDITHFVVDQMVINDQIREEDRGQVLRALLLKHKHVSEKKAFIRRNLSYSNLRGLDRRQHGSLGRGHKTASSIFKTFSSNSLRTNSEPGPLYTKMHPAKFSETSDVKVDIDNNKHIGLYAIEESEMVSLQSSGTHQGGKQDLDILKKIPKDAEVTTVLVGEVDFLKSPAIAFVRLAEGLKLENLTEVPLPVRFLFILLGPISVSMDYHEVGRSMSTLMSDCRFHEVAYKADDKRDLLGAINEFLDESIVLPPGNWGRKTLLPIMDMARKKAKQRKKRRQKKEKEMEKIIKEKEDPLKRTGQCFGGMIREVKKRYPLYLSDLKDAINLQCLAAFFFIYFAALSPAITFGGLLSEKTYSLIGVSETLIATSVSGVLFCLLAGQPLLILGATGPVIVFEEALYSFCQSTELEYLPMRAWIGIWFAIISIVLVGFDGIFLIRFVTRFTEEIFAFLISLIFIFEVFNKLAKVYQEHPLVPYYPPPVPVFVNTTDNNTVPDHFYNATLDTLNTTHDDNSSSALADRLKEEALRNQPNTALLSTILMLGTFFIAYFLKDFRNSKFLGRSARRAIGDFGIPIAIAVMVLVDYLIRDVYTTKLSLPDGLSPTNASARGWFINPMGMHQSTPIYVMFAAVLPALLVFILVFMESEITAVIVNKKERKLKKGVGYHLDCLLLGILNGVCGMFGLPFLCAATVRSVSHVAALTTMSRTQAPGERPQIEEVKEQRLTGASVNLMIGVSVLMGPVLRQIPLPVLFGVFLYMGVASLSGIKLWERVNLLFMPIKHHPDVGFVRRVRTWKMNAFTLIQLVCLGALWAIKSTPAALGFPFVLIMMVPIRFFVLKYFFTKQELSELDGDGPDIVEDSDASDDEEEDEPDFYQH